MNKKIIAPIGIVLGLLLIVAFSFGWYLSPLLYPFPKPSGTFSVGEKRYHWNNLSIDVFYPADNVGNGTRLYPYQSRKIEALKKVLPSYSRIPRWMWSILLHGLKSYANPHAQLSLEKPRYPVIVYLPGIGGQDLHNVYLEELASHGYVVVAIEPPFDTFVTVAADNKILTLDATLRSAAERVDRKAIYEYRNNAHKRWFEYIESVIKKMQHLDGDTTSLWYKKFDFDRIGILGHSHGGAVALDFCQKNDICKVGINMDGWTKTYNSSMSFTTPFMFLLSEHGEMPEMNNLFKNNQRSDFQKIVIKGAGHDSFTDMVLMKWPLSNITRSTAENVRNEISNHIVRFFNNYLREQ